MVDVSSADHEAFANSEKLRIFDRPTYGIDWSPDGEQLVVSFVPKKSKTFRLATLTPDGDDEPQLIPGQPEGNNKQPAWSPDGKSIVFVRMSF